MSWGAHQCENGVRQWLTWDYISATMTYVLWHEERLWKAIVLQRAQLFDLVCSTEFCQLCNLHSVKGWVKWELRTGMELVTAYFSGMPEKNISSYIYLYLVIYSLMYLLIYRLAIQNLLWLPDTFLDTVRKWELLDAWKVVQKNKINVL